MIDILNVSMIPEHGSKLAEEAFRVIPFTDQSGGAKYFGFLGGVSVSLIYSWKRGGLRETLLKAFKEWENEAKRVYNVPEKRRLILHVELDESTVIVDGKQVFNVEAEHYLRYRFLPLPVLELRLTAELVGGEKCEVILVTVGIPSIVGLIQMLAPLVNCRKVFSELLEAYGIKVTETVPEVGQSGEK